jgi:hypothetical protein
VKHRLANPNVPPKILKVNFKAYIHRASHPIISCQLPQSAKSSVEKAINEQESQLYATSNLDMQGKMDSSLLQPMPL